MATVAWADECHDPYAQLGLTESQAQAVARAKETHSVEILVGEVDGVPRTLVIMGEVHVQDKTTYRNAQNLINHFPDRGLEGYPGSVFWKALRDTAYFLEGLFSGRLQGSSITYAHAHKELSDRAEKLVKRYKLRDKTSEELEAFQYRFMGNKITGTQLLQLAETPAKNIALEENFKPSLGDRGKAWLIPSIYIADRLAPLTGLAGLPLALENPTLGVTVAVTSGLTWAGASIMKFGGMDDIAHTLGVKRDVAMSQKVLTSFQEDPNRKVLLLVVGRNHIYRIRENLRDQGFQWDWEKSPQK